MLLKLKIYFKFSILIICCILSVACNTNKNFVLNSMMTEQDANRLMFMLSEHEIGCDKLRAKDGTYSLIISSDSKDDAIEIMLENGLPSNKFTNLGEIFKKDGFISSPIEEKSRFIYALQQQISDMIMQFNGVTSVVTNVSMPISDDLVSNDNSNAAAAVLIRYKYGYNITTHLARIKRLVANSVPSLLAEHVEVTLVPVFQDNN
jgi:type III secretion protein J